MKMFIIFHLHGCTALRNRVLRVGGWYRRCFSSPFDRFSFALATPAVGPVARCARMGFVVSHPSQRTRWIGHPATCALFFFPTQNHCAPNGENYMQSTWHLRWASRRLRAPQSGR